MRIDDGSDSNTHKKARLKRSNSSVYAELGEAIHEGRYQFVLLLYELRGA